MVQQIVQSGRSRAIIVMPKKTLQEGVKAWKRKRKQCKIQGNAKHEWDNAEHKFLRKEWHNYDIWKPPKI